MTRLHVFLVIVTTIVAVTATSSQATPPGTNGRIVFERLRLQNTPWGELFVMNADGTGVRKLTHPPSGTEDTNADWSPDGSRIVFARAPSSGVHSIWVVKPDGTGLRRLTPNCPPGVGIPKCKADDGWPVWSPDGKHIAFQRLSGPLRPKGATREHREEDLQGRARGDGRERTAPAQPRLVRAVARRPADPRVVAGRQAPRLPREERQRRELLLSHSLRRQRQWHRTASADASVDRSRRQGRLVAGRERDPLPDASGRRPERFERTGREPVHDQPRRYGPAAADARRPRPIGVVPGSLLSRRRVDRVRDERRRRRRRSLRTCS